MWHSRTPPLCPILEKDDLFDQITKQQEGKLSQGILRDTQENPSTNSMRARIAASELSKPRAHDTQIQQEKKNQHKPTRKAL